MRCGALRALARAACGGDALSRRVPARSDNCSSSAESSPSAAASRCLCAAAWPPAIDPRRMHGVLRWRASGEGGREGKRARESHGEQSLRGAGGKARCERELQRGCGERERERAGERRERRD
eukprot:4539329-Prymnesium_polylepis.1